MVACQVVGVDLSSEDIAARQKEAYHKLQHCSTDLHLSYNPEEVKTLLRQVGSTAIMSFGCSKRMQAERHNCRALKLSHQP